MDFDVAIGRIVTYVYGENEDNFTVLPAIITKVWSRDVVNLTVFTDGTTPGENTTFPSSSVQRGDGGGQWLPYDERNIVN